jgi:Leucine-rich repeat (LRR) protein
MKLSNLEVLNLARNGLTKVPEGISHLKKLKRLDLSHNQLTTLPREIASLAGSLTNLDFQGNQIPRDQIDWFIEAMPSTDIRF